MFDIPSKVQEFLGSKPLLALVSTRLLSMVCFFSRITTRGNLPRLIVSFSLALLLKESMLTFPVTLHEEQVFEHILLCFMAMKTLWTQIVESFVRNDFIELVPVMQSIGDGFIASSVHSMLPSGSPSALQETRKQDHSPKHFCLDFATRNTHVRECLLLHALYRHRIFHQSMTLESSPPQTQKCESSFGLALQGLTKRGSTYA